MKTKLIITFNSHELLGSPQYLHFFDNDNSRKEAIANFQVKDEFDHSFINLKEKEAQVSWKNKKGVFQFCGSGAYALAWLLSRNESRQRFSIKTDSMHLKYFRDEKCLTLSFPHSSLQSSNIKKHYYSKSGIHIFELGSKQDLLATRWQDFANKSIDTKIHGLCLFYWDQNNSSGYLRYFTPWHGREEDHVTGSIHQLLTPLISKLYDVRHQYWIQLSPRGGTLKTQFRNKKVFLSGNCRVANLS